jgi:transcriptional antiterminator NusG
VHTYSGYEHKVKASLEERIRSLTNPDLFGEILVPSEKVVELVKGKKKTSSRKFFPGYILVNMRSNNETWHIVKSTPKVTGFLGGATDPDSIPPISESEVREITHQMEEGAVKPKPKVLFEQGENVKVIDGPFQDFNGVVEEVKPDKGKLRVPDQHLRSRDARRARFRPGGEGVAGHGEESRSGSEAADSGRRGQPEPARRVRRSVSAA